MAQRNTSRGWASELVAVPEVTSTIFFSRFFRFRHRTQNFSTSSPCTVGARKSATSSGRLSSGASVFGGFIILRPISIIAMSSCPLARPMPFHRWKSVGCQEASPAIDPASATSRRDRSISWPVARPLCSTSASSSVSLRAAAPKASSRACGCSPQARVISVSGVSRARSSLDWFMTLGARCAAVGRRVRFSWRAPRAGPCGHAQPPTRPPSEEPCAPREGEGRGRERWSRAKRGLPWRV